MSAPDEPPRQGLSLDNVLACTLHAQYSLEFNAILCWLETQAAQPPTVLQAPSKGVTKWEVGEAGELPPSFFLDNVDELVRSLGLDDRKTGVNIEWLENRVRGLERELGWLRGMLRDAGYQDSTSLEGPLRRWLDGRKG